MAEANAARSSSTLSESLLLPEGLICFQLSCLRDSE